MTYLFFDIECANSFGGIGKICSFGYVLCNSDFTVIKTEDILINPDVPFDWYLFKKGSKCRLSHRREEYQKQEKFPHFYSKIKSLLEGTDRLVIGFGCTNDISAIMCECIRYGLEPIDFALHDIHTVLEKFYEAKGGLGSFVERFGIDTHGMEFHDSRADAFFTMKVTERLVNDSEKPLQEILAPFSPSLSIQVYKSRIKKLFKTWLTLNEEKDAAEGKSPRVHKKVSVPKWFDFRKELLREIDGQKG